MDVRNFEVVVDNLEENPHCLHGPTLIFQKISDKVKDYYACSACRDYSSCNFHLPVNEKKEILLQSSNFWKEKQEEIVCSLNKLEPYRKFIEVLNTVKNEADSVEKSSSNDLRKSTKSCAGYCYTCCCLFQKSDCKKHKKCQVLSNLTYYQLTHPTTIIMPKTNSKTHAQYFFSESTVKEISLLLLKLKASKVLCIGVPRIHEYIANVHKNEIKSLLLDIDKNYFHFYNKNEFVWYNMFNNYIFDKTQEAVLFKFFQSGKIIVLMDPPFGGRVEPLARTLNMLNDTFIKLSKGINEEGKLKLETFWFFPYFMEQHIRNSLPDFNMFDYKVNYDNHSSFTNVGNKKRKFGSPVRIFTNVPFSLLDLKGVSGYKFCQACGFWVSEENKHCKECNACTSKNGRTYVHCKKCSKCVKPSYKHCDLCSRCCLSDHVCGEFQPNRICYHCHQSGHKKRECPFWSANKKRSSVAPKVPEKKRKINE